MSKSKKHSKSPQKPVEARRPEDDGLLDEVHVPQGTSKLKFILILALMIFTLVIFTIGDSLSMSAGRNRANDAFMTWEHPTRGTMEVSNAEFFAEKRRLRPFDQMRGRREAPTDGELAVELINDQLALDAGIAVTDGELRKAILEGFEGEAAPHITAQNYDTAMRFYGMTKQEYEMTLRRKMRVSRYKKLLMPVATVPDPDAIEKAWKENHQEYAYDYIALAHASLDDEAQAALPSDEDLTTWFDELPNKQSLFYDDYKPATVTAELVSVPADSEPTVLLERYPSPAEESPESPESPDAPAEEPTPEDTDATEIPEQEDPDALAQSYFNQFAHTRFRREEPVETEELNALRDSMLYTFEEKADEARREAPIHAAMQRWLQDVQARAAAGEEVDLAAEATELGLEHMPADTPRTQAEWAELERLGGPFLGGAMIGTPAGEFGTSVVVDPGGPMVLRVSERTDRQAPEFAEVREKVVDEWKKEKVAELAQEKLQGLRDALFAAPAEGGEVPETITDEAFRTAASEAGLEVQRRDWLELGAQNTVDPNYDDAAHAFLRSMEGPPRLPDAVSLSQMEEGQVTEVQRAPGLEDAASYLVRVVGKRDPVELNINPNELEQLELQAGFIQFGDFLERNMSADAYRDRFQLQLVGDEEPQP